MGTGDKMSWGNLLTYDGLASIPGGVAILLVGFMPHGETGISSGSGGQFDPSAALQVTFIKR